MKFNLKNRPGMVHYQEGWTKEQIDEIYEQWFEGFEKELREIVKDAEKMHPRGPYRGILVLGKEILGEPK